MNRLWEEIAPIIEAGQELPKVDFKENLKLSNKPEQAEFSKDVAAIANTGGGTGYIIIGVVEAGKRRSEHPNDYIPGFKTDDPDGFQRRMIQSLSTYIDPPPEIQYREVTHPQTGKNLSIVVIPMSTQRPHVFVKDGEGVRKGDIPIRRGPETFLASRNELLEMSGDHWLPRLEEERKVSTEIYRDVVRDATDWQLVAESTCRSLYTALPKSRRGKVIRSILSSFGKEAYFDEWFGDT